MSALNNLTKDPVKLALGVSLVIGVVYVLGRKAVGDVAGAAAGVVTGNNAITQNARTDAYEGKGVLGTLGAATDAASGGLLSRFGEWIGGKVFDLTHSSPSSTSPRASVAIGADLRPTSVTPSILPPAGNMSGQAIF